MSAENARAAAIAAYKAMAMNAYGSASRLMGRVDYTPNVTGETFALPVVGVKQAVTRTSGQVVAAGNPEIKRPVVQFQRREAFDRYDRNDRVITNADIAERYAVEDTRAVGRAVDGDILEALGQNKATDPGFVAAYSHPGVTAAGMTIETGMSQELLADDVAKAKARLMHEMDTDDPNPDDFTLVYPALQFEHLATDEKLASRDYTTGQPSRTGNLTAMYGCVPVGIGRRQGQGGALPERTAYMFHRNGIGLASAYAGVQTVWEWETTTQSWLIGAYDYCKAARTQNAACVTITIKA